MQSLSFRDSEKKTSGILLTELKKGQAGEVIAISAGPCVPKDAGRRAG